jgi:type IV pilus assembly protein PilV
MRTQFGILLFSIGILALVGLQANAAKQSVEGKYRSDASMLATQLIGQIWATDRNFATLNTTYSSTLINDGVCSGCATDFASWYDLVKTTLPGTTDLPPNVTYTLVPPSGAATLATTRISITIYWRSPDNITHNYVALTQIQEIPPVVLP